MHTGHKNIFLGLFFLSGACGLTYEIVWSRLLVLVFGGTTFAITTVLTCFMGGLALGSFLAGRRSSRAARPERVYGLLEIGIGLMALAVPVLLELSTGVYRALAGAVGDSFLLLTGARVLVSGFILLLPTTAMGATLPLLVSAFARHGKGGGGGVAVLYGANTLGAFVGCAGAGFFLLPKLGLSGSTLTAAVLNLAAGSVALLLARRSPRREPEAAAETGAGEARQVPSEAATAATESIAGSAPSALGRLDVPSKVGNRTLLALYALSGFAAMAYQVAWTRALILSLGSSTYSFSLIVSCYIFGLAVGSLGMSRWVDTLKRPLAVAGSLQGLIALGALFVVPLFGELPAVVARATGTEGASFSSVLWVEALWVFGLLVVPTLAMGALLPLICRIYDPADQQAGRSVGDVYAANTAGTIVGAAVAGFVLIPWSPIGMEHTIHLASGLNLLVGSAFLLAEKPRKVLRYALAGGAWAAAVLAVGVTEPWSRERMVSGPYLGRDKAEEWDVVFYREGVDTTVAVEKLGDTGKLSLSVNGKPDASNILGDMPTQMLLGIIPALLRPAAREVCIIGLGSGMSVGSLLLFDVERVDVAEISQGVVEGSRYFDPDSHAPLDDPRVHLHRADGRNLLLLADRRYDMILSEPSNPWISGVSNLFTREFFELARSRLVPGGLHAQWIQGYTISPDDIAAILRTLGEVFPHYQVWEMSLNDYLVVASTEPLAIDMESLYFSFQHPPLQRELGRIYITNPLQLANHYITDREHLSPWLAEAEVLSDDHNFLEFDAPHFLLSETQHDIALAIYRLGAAPAFADDSDGVLEQIFTDVVERSRKRGLRFREIPRAASEDMTAYVRALNETITYARTDIRTLFAIAEQVQSLVESGAPVSGLDARMKRIKPEAWPFGRIDPRPTVSLLAGEGRKLIEGGGDLRAACAHLLRAWLREPANGEVLYDLARAYAGRGQREKALGFIAAARQAGSADGDRIAAEPLFDALRGDPRLDGGP